MILKIIYSFLKRWFHCLIRTFLIKEKHRECSLVTSDLKGNLTLKIYCECGKVFGTFKIKKVSNLFKL